MKKNLVICIVSCCLAAIMLATAISISIIFGINGGVPTYYDEMNKIFEEENKTVTKGQVVFVGDSITDFCDLSKYYPGLTAYNRGIGGDTTSGLLLRMDNSIFDLEPKVVVLLIGINDISLGKSPNDVATNIASILNQIKQRLPETKVIVQSVYPVGASKDFDEHHNKIRSLNARLAMSVSRDFGYTFVDMTNALRYEYTPEGASYSYFILNPSYSDDGLHPNDAGYKAIAQVLRPIIDSLLAEQSA